MQLKRFSLLLCSLIVAPSCVRHGQVAPGANAPAPTSVTAAQPAAEASRHINQNFAGEWTGVLEYRDYGTNERVFLPTWLTMTAEVDGSSVREAFIYDDGPTKTVREAQSLNFDVADNKATLVSDEGKSRTTYVVAGLEQFRKLDRGGLVLTGAGTENDKPVEVRITLKLGRNLFTWLKETRPAGSSTAYQFRDAYTLTRRSPPKI